MPRSIAWAAAVLAVAAVVSAGAAGCRTAGRTGTWGADLAACRLTAPYASIGVGGGIRVDTTASTATWNVCAQVGGGRLSPGCTYQARVTCRIDELGPDAYLLLLVRPIDAGDGLSDLTSAQVSAIGAVRTISLRFTVPAGRADYAVQIHTRRQVRALVSAVDIAEGTSDVVIPAGASGAAPPSLPADPAGAEEFSIDQPHRSIVPAVSVGEFGADPAAGDNTAAFNRAIEACRRSKASGLIVPRGIYRFTSDEPVVFANLVDATVDGQGSTLVFLKARSDLVQIRACQRVVIKDLRIDWDWDRDPLASVVRVESAAPDRLDVRFVDHQRFPRRDVRVADIEQLDPATMSVGCEGAVNASFEFFRGTSPAPRTEWLGDNLLRIHLEPARPSLARIASGTMFRMRHYVYDMNGFAMRDNAHLTLSGIDVLSCPGHAFVSDGDQHHWQFVRTNVVRPAGTKRPITCTADHHHVARSQGYFKMIGCEFSLGGDDCLNIHDTTGFAVRSGDQSVLTRNLRAWSTFHPGDRIELREDDFTPTGTTAGLVRISPVDAAAGVYELVFDAPVPKPAGDGFVLFNRRYGSRQVVVRDCSFHDNRARGLLLLGSDMTIENNRFFHNQMGAIKIETGYTLDLWSEGYGASNIVIRNNRFESVNPMGSYPDELRPAIYMSVYLRTDPSREKTRYPILKDILVEGNSFIDCPGAIINVCSASRVMIRGNVVENQKPRISESPFRGWIGANHASGVYVTGNTWTRSAVMPSPSVAFDPETASAIHCWGNSVR